MNNPFENLTLDEKLKLLTGKDFWRTEDCGGKVPFLRVSDGPHGLRKEEDGKTICSTSFPSLSSLGNTWNTELSFLEGEAIASCCVENKVDVILAPGVNIKRSPFNGRNFEYFSEDPYLSGTMGKSYIEGVQSLGIGACLKHFACNNYEYGREFRSSEVDERTLFEIYLKPFEIALEANPWSMMPAYNCLNGIYCCENKYLVSDVLRDRFHYKGYVISDWGAVHSSPKSLLAGVDLRMAYDQRAFGELKKAYDDGFINDEAIDRSINALSEIISKTDNEKKKVKYDKGELHAISVKIAEEGIVLLKNANNALPLSKEAKILVSGVYSEHPLIGGGGSSLVKTDYKIPTLANALKEAGHTVQCRSSFDSVMTFDAAVVVQRGEESDAIILGVGVPEKDFSEGYDRLSLRLSKPQEQMIHLMASLNKKVIVVIYAGGVIDTSDWQDEVDAIVLAGYGGEGINEALANILSGKVSPSGKLAESFVSLPDNDVISGVDKTDSVERYTEGVFVGYRGYLSDRRSAEKVLYPFGFGLSYANFEYSNLEIVKKDGSFEVNFDLANMSEIEAKEAVELYVSDLSSSVSRPKRELKRFEKVTLGPKETKRVSFVLTNKDLMFYNSCLHDWYLENGLFRIEIGASCVDIRLVGTIDIEQDGYLQYTRER